MIEVILKLKNSIILKKNALKSQPLKNKIKVIFVTLKPSS